MKCAIFLAGGPGSGKDIILKHCLENVKYKEYKIEQIKPSVQEDCIVITANAYRTNDVLSCKNILESEGFKTLMIFVDVDDSISKERLKERNILEEKRQTNLQKSKDNIFVFENSFDYFIKFDNNSDSIDYDFNLIENFILNFVYEDLFLFEKKKQNQYSILKKLTKGLESKKGFIRMGDKVQTDRIGDEYSVRNAAIGYPSTVGPFYNEDFSQQYSDTLPAFAADNRTIDNTPPKQDKPLTNSIFKKRLNRIKTTAKNAWKKNV